MTNEDCFIDPYKTIASELNKMIGKKHQVEIEEIKCVFKRKDMTKGGFYIREGDIPDSIGFIVKGLMKYYYIDDKGNEWIKHFSCENDFVASYASYLYQIPSPYFIEALEDTILYTIEYGTFVDNINSSMKWNSIARKYTEKIYYEKERRESSLLKKDGRERYAEFLENFKRLIDRISLKDTASFLGLTPVSLSRIRNNKQGINKC